MWRRTDGARSRHTLRHHLRRSGPDAPAARTELRRPLSELVHDRDGTIELHRSLRVRWRPALQAARHVPGDARTRHVREPMTLLDFA